MPTVRECAAYRRFRERLLDALTFQGIPTLEPPNSVTTEAVFRLLWAHPNISEFAKFHQAVMTWVLHAEVGPAADLMRSGSVCKQLLLRALEERTKARQ